MGTQLQLRAGEVDFSFESDDPITVDQAKDFIEQVQRIAATIGAAPKANQQAPANGASGNAEPNASASKGANDGIDLHMNSVADKLEAKSGPELALAAAAYLQLVTNKDRWSRDDLLEAMKLATNHFNQNMRKNLTAIIKSLIGSRINQHANDTYALKSGELMTLRAKLAD